MSHETILENVYILYFKILLHINNNNLDTNLFNFLLSKSQTNVLIDKQIIVINFLNKYNFGIQKNLNSIS